MWTMSRRIVVAHLGLSTAEKPHTVRRTPVTLHIRLLYQHGHRRYGAGVMAASLKPLSRIDILQQAYEEIREELKELGTRCSWISIEDFMAPLRVCGNGKILYRRRIEIEKNEKLAWSAVHKRWALRSLPLVIMDGMAGILFATIQEDRARE